MALDYFNWVLIWVFNCFFIDFVEIIYYYFDVYVLCLVFYIVDIVDFIYWELEFDYWILFEGV